jgi:DHA2 family multidrug resistance protein
VDARLLIVFGFLLFIVGSLFAMPLSGDFAGPQFIYSSVVRAIAQVMVMMPLAAISVAGIEREHAGSAAALFNMLRNLGGAIGIALLQTFLTKREQLHSDVLTSQVSVSGEATRARLQHLTDVFMTHVTTDPSVAQHDAAIAIGRTLRRQALILGFSDTIILQSVLLGLALVTVFFLKRSRPGAAGEAH